MRHTARRLASNPSAVLSQGRVLHPQWEGGGCPILGWWGTPNWGVLLSIWDWGTPTPWTGVHPRKETWNQSLGYPSERTWCQWKYYGMEMGYSQKGHGTSKSIMGWRWGTPLLVWTDTHLWKQYIHVVLRMQTVKISKKNFVSWTRLCKMADRPTNNKKQNLKKKLFVILLLGEKIRPLSNLNIFDSLPAD